MKLNCFYQGIIEVPSDFECEYCGECDFCTENEYDYEESEEE